VRPDAELVRAAGGGDADAWGELVDRHSQLVFANSRAVGADPTLAQDITQLVWIRLLNRLDTIREPDKLRGWLAIVARNLTRSELRRSRTMVGLDELFSVADPQAAAPDGEAVRDEEVRSVRRALREISERCRELLTLLFGAEMSYEEIAETTGMPLGSIGPTRQRCLHQVERQLGEETADA